MKYTELFFRMKDVFTEVKTRLDIGNKEIFKCEFNSEAHKILPGVREYHCEIHNLDFIDGASYFNDIGPIEEPIHVNDIFIQENNLFNYYLLKPQSIRKADKIIFIFHGFNEKNWDKYLPWGEYLCEKTQSAIIFFPIAFHMQRAPLAWSEKRKMFELSERRKLLYPNIINSTLSNVAISMRLHSMPQRFIWSGLQTYYDVIHFIEDCKNGNNEFIDKEFNINILAYSIGGLLAEILKLTNYKNYFDNAKVCLFCSGAVFNRITPVSKFILDSEANVALYSYLVEHFDSFLKKDAFLNHYISENHIEGKVFHSMLEYQKMRDFREGLLKQSENHIYAISLKKDTVIPSFEIINTLQGAYRNINIAVDELDFEYSYIHENPFPANTLKPELVDDTFEMVFDRICEFYK